jgi:hypothetical protein
MRRVRVYSRIPRTGWFRCDHQASRARQPCGDFDLQRDRAGTHTSAGRSREVKVSIETREGINRHAARVDEDLLPARRLAVRRLMSAP